MSIMRRNVTLSDDTNETVTLNEIVKLMAQWKDVKDMVVAYKTFIFTGTSTMLCIIHIRAAAICQTNLVQREN